MKAKVQYNDFLGTAAADISDHLNLNDFLSYRGVSTEKYEAIGASFYSGYNNYFSASIICIDKELSTASKKHIVQLDFENKFDKDEFFDLFKRFNVIITKRFEGYENLEIEEEITIDNREKKEDEE